MYSLDNLKSRLLRGNGDRSDLIRGGAGSLGVKSANMIAGFLVVIVLARALGPDEYGLYAYVYAVVSILAIPVEFGLPTLVVRGTAQAHLREQHALMAGLWRWAVGAVGALCAALLVAVVAGVWLAGDMLPEHALPTVSWAILLIPLIAFTALAGGALRGLGRTVQGQLPGQVIKPILLGGSALAVATAFKLDATVAMQLHVIAAAFALGFAIWFLTRAAPPKLPSERPEYRSREWAMAIVPLALASGLQLINRHVDILVLGLFASAADVGIYRVVINVSSLCTIGLQAVNMVVSPYFARIHAQGDMQKLQRLVTAAARATLLFALPVSVLFLLFGREIIELLFGQVYGAGYGALVWLTFGQLVNAAMGSVGFLLTMTGHEKEFAKGVAFGALLNLVLNFLLVPRFGMEGAAAATATTFALWNLVLWRTARRRLGIDSTAFGLFASRGR